MTQFVKAKPEVLRLYREILRTSRQFQWSNEQGQQWAKILQENARMEIEQSRHDTDSASIARKVFAGWDCLHQVQEKMMAKAKTLQNEPNREK